MFRFIIFSLILSASLVVVADSFASSSYLKNAKELARQGLYFTAIPFVKEYLARGNVSKNSSTERLIDEIVSESGVRQFEVLPFRILERSDAPVIRYILAKKYFRKGEYQKSLMKLKRRIPILHSVKPFALFLEGSVLSLMGRHSQSIKSYRECIRISKMHIKRTDDPNRIRQLYINKDNCVVGIPRSQFGAKDYKSANLMYLDLEKDSYIWPEILFEEAWNSFYLKDYNRTLGKLVTYKAPIFNYLFNPEVEILKGLSYLHLCLYEDVGRVVKNYYDKYKGVAQRLQQLTRRLGRNYKSYFTLGRSYAGSKKEIRTVMDKMMSTITRDPAFIEQMEAYNRGVFEIKYIKNVSERRNKIVLKRNLRLSLELQRDLIGAYVRKNLKIFSSQIKKGFEGMTYMRLEVLSRKKKLLYSNVWDFSRKRGDIKYLRKNDKQYFWTFNGEFWADELGDYVFALRSECSR